MDGAHQHRGHHVLHVAFLYDFFFFSSFFGAIIIDAPLFIFKKWTNREPIGPMIFFLPTPQIKAELECSVPSTVFFLSPFDFSMVLRESPPRYATLLLSRTRLLLISRVSLVATMYQSISYCSLMRHMWPPPHDSFSF